MNKNNEIQGLPEPIQSKRTKTMSFEFSKTHLICINGNKRSTLVELIKADHNLFLLFNIVCDSLTTPWFTNHAQLTKDSYANSIKKFFIWAQNQVRIDHNAIKDFEQYEINSLGKKPQSCLSHQINALVKHAKYNSKLSSEQSSYIVKLLRYSRPVANTDPKQSTLTNWFTRYTWIKSKLGDRFLSLESPKRLMNSFRTCIAVSLLYLIDSKKQLRENGKTIELIESLPHGGGPNFLNRQIAALLSKSVELDENQNPCDSLSNILWNDLVIYKHQQEVKTKIMSCGIERIASLVSGKTSSFPFKPPSYLSDNLKSVSILEETLAYWLCASLAMQPSDIQSLKRADIAIEKNSSGRIIFVEINYYKTRSDRKYKPPLLNGTDIVARALLEYLDTIGSASEFLFRRKILRKINFVNPFYKQRVQTTTNPLAFLNRLWRSEHMNNILEKAYLENGTDNLFVTSLHAFFDENAIDHDCWSTLNKNQSFDTYLQSVAMPMPQTYFGVSLIKNSAVHARTDKYRDMDITNDNSHTSLTEKLSYMTDSNKEWVNQVGRVTRMVFEDITDNVYSNALALDTNAIDKISKTRILVEQHINAETIDITGRVELDQNSPRIDENVVVVESENTAITMMHYIDQADKFKKVLANRNPLFFAHTVLVNVEWMHFCLTNFDTKLVHTAHKKLQKIKQYLPDIFDHEIRGGF